jgi:hypothetical protein
VQDQLRIRRQAKKQLLPPKPLSIVQYSLQIDKSYYPLHFSDLLDLFLQRFKNGLDVGSIGLSLRASSSEI